jgi:hypothetical protein
MFLAISGYSFINSKNSFSASIYKILVFSCDSIFTCLASELFKAHSHKKSHFSKIANCLVIFFSFVVYPQGAPRYFSTDSFHSKI